jgi:hypothetical protein
MSPTTNLDARFASDSEQGSDMAGLLKRAKGLKSRTEDRQSVRLAPRKP